MLVCALWLRAGEQDPSRTSAQLPPWPVGLEFCGAAYKGLLLV